ncbi:terminase large subunit [Flagellimonas sp.]|uniref:terminase large subunit n=1 Tax=Flagellimonas sp. TaxID=2058762 RepID=UPI003F4A4DE3
MKITKEIQTSIPFNYALQVANGKLVTGRKMVLAAERFLNLMEGNNDYFFDHANGMHAIDFYPTFLKHTSGPLAGKPFHLMPHQQFGLYQLFGLKKINEHGELVRLIRTVYDKVARKNGKSATGAGLGLYCQSFDGESGPEIYVGATTRDQAKIIWEQAEHYIRTSSGLQQIGFTTTQSEIRFPRTLGKFKAVSKEARNLDGLKPSIGIIDEYHAHATDDVREVLESGMGNRKQPILYILTTAGFNLSSVCKAYEEVCIEILTGKKQDDSTLILIHDLDEGDDWEDRENWIKANPNLGKSVFMDFLIGEYTKAKNQPSKAPNFKTKHLNMWVDAPTVWIPKEIWSRNKVTEIQLSKFKEYGCYGAVDLSTTTDITAVVFLSEPDENEVRYLLPFFFCPNDTIEHRSKEDRVPYRAWRDEGFLIATKGNTVDYKEVERLIVQKNENLNVIRNGFDKWNASQMVNNLTEEGLECSYFSQAITNISYPTKQFEKLVYEGKIKHDGNPIMTWMLAGCVIYRDANENIKVHKGQSHAGVKRIDGIVAAIMALGESLTDEEQPESKYNDFDFEQYLKLQENGEN